MESYFAMRSFSVGEDAAGVKRLFLNGKPYFHNGLLDQGWWPDGLYTAPSDEALRFDIETAKAMGFNMLRKHVKIEPLRWYYHCDKLGMLVWQDMPNGGGSYNAAVISAPLLTGWHMKDNKYGAFGRRDERGRAEFTQELREMVTQLYNCPCIAMWVPFNEGWGQFDAEKNVAAILEIDATRTIDHASGWHDQGIGEIKSRHVYFDDYRYEPDKKAAASSSRNSADMPMRWRGIPLGTSHSGIKNTSPRTSCAAASRCCMTGRSAPPRGRVFPPRSIRS